MPITPLHFGPSATLAFCLKKHLDLPIFVLANVVIDFEPLMVMIFHPNYPLHGFCHTLIVGTLIGAMWGIFAFFARNFTKKFMRIFLINYQTNLKLAVTSGMLGFHFHILLDSVMHSDIKPFYPSSYNPLYRIISVEDLYFLCAIFFIPAFVFYIIQAIRFRHNEKNGMPKT